MYDLKTSIGFWRTTGKYGCFSNFSKHPVEYDGIVYPTSEHFYQAMKSEDVDFHLSVSRCGTPKMAKGLGQHAVMKENWDEIKHNVMLFVLGKKVEQHSEIKDLLLETGIKVIYEDSPYDYIWGIGKDGTGQNLLGRAWMELRSQLLAMNFDI